MKRTKELTWEQVLILIKQCKHYADCNYECSKKCPIFGECLYHYTGDDSQLWEDDSEE